MTSKITTFFAPKNKRIKLNTICPEEDVYILMFDGGSRGNPGTAGAGFVIYKNDVELFAGCAPLGHATNNFAEYKGLELGLQYAIDNNIKTLAIKGDSKLVLNQVTNKWKVKALTLQEVCRNCKKLLHKLDKYTVEHVRRKYNKRADEMANKAMDGVILTS